MIEIHQNQLYERHAYHIDESVTDRKAEHKWIQSKIIMKSKQAGI